MTHAATARNLVYRLPISAVTLAPREPLDVRVLGVFTLRPRLMRELHRFYAGISWAVLAARNFNTATRIWCVYSRNTLIHVSWVLAGRAIRRYQFVPADGFMIGPCVTAAAARGQGIYPWIIQRIVVESPAAPGGFWIFNHEANIASGKGIVKAGGIVTGHFTRTKHFFGLRSHFDYTPLA